MTPDRTPLSAIGAIVRRADPDRFLTALFAPPARREALFTLYAFNDEIARAREVAREPMMALIRLQWWREVVEGIRKAHPVATALGALLDRGMLDAADLLDMLDAREAADVPTVAAWHGWLLQGPGALAAAASKLLGGEGAERVRNLGAGYGAAGTLRSLVPLASTGQCMLPAELLTAHGLTAGAVIADPQTPALLPVIDALMAEGRRLLGQPRHLAPDLAAGLPAVLARRDLRQPASRLVQPRARGLADRLAVLAAAALGRA